MPAPHTTLSLRRRSCPATMHVSHSAKQAARTCSSEGTIKKNVRICLRREKHFFVLVFSLPNWKSDKLKNQKSNSWRRYPLRRNKSTKSEYMLLIQTLDWYYLMAENQLSRCGKVLFLNVSSFLSWRNLGSSSFHLVIHPFLGLRTD
jgi:hypothetical protein